MKLAAVTCTGDRPEAFDLCRQYVERQTRQPDEWIVVDDGHLPSEAPATAKAIRLPPIESYSLARNLFAAIRAAEALNADAVAFIEDDDWYDARWLAWCERALTDAPIVGECRALYYHVGRRGWHQHDNRHHASLCSTAIRRDLFETLKTLCLGGDPFVDTRLWSTAGIRPQRFPTHLKPPLVVGIKGMPGRTGIGCGHRPELLRYEDDPELIALRRVIGPDADRYATYGSSARQ